MGTDRLPRRWSRALAAVAVASLALAGPALAVSVSEFPFQAAYGVSPVDVAAGPDGALWFTLTNAPYGSIGRITLAGAFTEFPVPTVLANPRQITAGPDGALWFTQAGGNRIGRITTSGQISEFQIPTPGSGPLGGIVAGPDGAVWFTEGLANKIGRITTSGQITEFAIPTPASGPAGITVGPDGALWFTEGFGNKIGRITTGGTVTEFALPTSASGPGGITSGPDGALWFTEFQGSRIGRITTTGAITEFPTPGRSPFRITAGPDGALWFTMTDVGSNIGRIGRVTTAGVITEYRTPTAGSWPLGIVPGPDGALWFTQFHGERIGRVSVGPAPTFADVADTNPFLAWIEALVAAGITGGCGGSPPQYCPQGLVTRGQMAVFLLRARHGAAYTPPAATGTMFADVAASLSFAPWIEQFATEGITGGCGANPPRYCPDATVTRGQMTVFLLRAKHGAGYQPPAATGTVFADVPASHPFAPWIEEVARQGIATGCASSPAKFCAEATVTRGQMAVFLGRAFNLL